MVHHQNGRMGNLAMLLISNEKRKKEKNSSSWPHGGTWGAFDPFTKDPRQPSLEKIAQAARLPLPWLVLPWLLAWNGKNCLPPAIACGYRETAHPPARPLLPQRRTEIYPQAMARGKRFSPFQASSQGKTNQGKGKRVACAISPVRADEDPW